MLYSKDQLDHKLVGQFQKVGMLSSGIGITPLRSMCKYCTDMRLNTEITLLYSNHSERDIIFRDELEKMQRQNDNFKVVLAASDHSSNWRSTVGRIDTAMIRQMMPDYMDRTFFTCGPPTMVEAMENLLKDLHIPQDHIRKEDFPGY